MTGVIGRGRSISACMSREAVAIICPRFGSMVSSSPVTPHTATTTHLNLDRIIVKFLTHCGQVGHLSIYLCKMELDNFKQPFLVFYFNFFRLPNLMHFFTFRRIHDCGYSWTPATLSIDCISLSLNKLKLRYKIVYYLSTDGSIIILQGKCYNKNEIHRVKRAHNW
jgi:hypothetical protein